MSALPTNIGERIRCLRLEMGMTQCELGDSIGTDKMTVYRYEHGVTKNVPNDIIISLANIFGVSTDYLLGLTDVDVPSQNGVFGNGVSYQDAQSNSQIQKRIIDAVLTERQRQDSKWGEQNHPPHYWTGILGEEYGELCEAINETVFDNGSDRGGYENMRAEAIHVAAVAIGFLECLERNKMLWFPEVPQDDQCVSCGSYVPEGRMVCPTCERNPSHALNRVGGSDGTGRYCECQGKNQGTL